MPDAVATERRSQAALQVGGPLRLIHHVLNVDKEILDEVVVGSKPIMSGCNGLLLILVPILARGGGPNVLGIGRMGRVNGYLIKDVSVNIKIKLKSFPETSKSRNDNQNKVLYEIPKGFLVVSYIHYDIR